MRHFLRIGRWIYERLFHFTPVCVSAGRTTTIPSGQLEAWAREAKAEDRPIAYSYSLMRIVHPDHSFLLIKKKQLTINYTVLKRENKH